MHRKNKIHHQKKIVNQEIHTSLQLYVIPALLLTTCVCVRGFVHLNVVPIEARRYQILELQLQVVMSQPTWLLQSYGRAGSDLNH